MNINLHSIVSHIVFLLKEPFVQDLTPQQKKIFAIASIAFGLLAACYAISFCYSILIGKEEELENTLDVSIEVMEDGQGKLTFPNGIMTEGEFEGSSLNGNGQIIFTDGETWEGEFIDNKFIRRETVIFDAEKRCKGFINPTIFKELLLVLDFMTASDKRKTLEIDMNMIGLTKELPSSHAFYVYKTIQGLAKLNENLDQCKQDLIENEYPSIFYFEGIREFPFHLENQKSLISSIENILFIFEKQYEHHKASATLYSFLMEAFPIFNGCFEKRSEALEKYHFLHPVDDATPLDLDGCTDYTKKSTFIQIISEELRVYQLKQDASNSYPQAFISQEPIDAEIFKRYLLHQVNITEIEGTDHSTHEIRKITHHDVEKVINILISSQFLK